MSRPTFLRPNRAVGASRVWNGDRAHAERVPPPHPLSSYARATGSAWGRGEQGSWKSPLPQPLQRGEEQGGQGGSRARRRIFDPAALGESDGCDVNQRDSHLQGCRFFFVPPFGVPRPKVASRDWFFYGPRSRLHAISWPSNLWPKLSSFRGAFYDSSAKPAVTERSDKVEISRNPQNLRYMRYFLMFYEEWQLVLNYFEYYDFR